jgi:membrane associated rhomboid family serine protease
MAERSWLPVAELLGVFAVVLVVQYVTALANLMGGLFVLSPPLTDNPWTILTSVYAHANVGHLTSNAIGLVIFGLPVAAAATRVRFHVFFAASGAIAGVSQIVLSDLLATLPVVGASSATAGVLGASGAVLALMGYVIAGNRLTSALTGRVELPDWLVYGVFVAIAAVITVATGSAGVALIAHFTGLLLGLVAGRFNALATRGVDSGRATSRPMR